MECLSKVIRVNTAILTESIKIALSKTCIGQVQGGCLEIPGTCSSLASFSANSFAQRTQSSIETPRTGMNGHTSRAPRRGCSPVMGVHVIGN